MNANPTSTGQVDAVVTAIDTVKQLIASGVLDATALGLTPPADARGALVPGTPITVRDLGAKARPALKASTLRTYGSYMKLLADGYTDPVNPSLTHPGLGDAWAHEVLPSQLEELLVFVKRRALVHAARRAASRHSVGRAVRESDGVGAGWCRIPHPECVRKRLQRRWHQVERWLSGASGQDSPKPSRAARRARRSPRRGLSASRSTSTWLPRASRNHLLVGSR